MDTKDVIRLYDDYIIPSYTRSSIPVVLTKGSGMRVWDINGKEYLDFFPGWGVSTFGHCHPKVVKAIRNQVNKLIHISNNYYHLPQGRLAKKIIQHSFDGKVFFANSGAEANEAAIKLARKYGSGVRYELITFENSFHGRTMATLTATGQLKHKSGFEPLLEGFKTVPFNNTEVVKNTISDKTVAIMVEPIQGEGGINVAKKEFMLFLRRLCDERKILLILDEVQTGMGRTGKVFAYQHYGVEPDVMTLAKGLGGGFPIGAMIARKTIADLLEPGSHASTFGGSPLACSAALAVFEVIEKGYCLSNVVKMGEYLLENLERLKKNHSLIKEIRGMGLMVGIELNNEGKSIFEKCLQKGLLINCTQERVLRLMPALNVTRAQIDRAIVILDEVLKI